MIHGLPHDLNNDMFLWVSACAALQPRLRSILLYDCPPKILETASVQLSQILQVTEKREIIITRLGPGETEDDLWGTLSPSRDGKTNTFTWQEGRLASSPDDKRIRIVMIPNLALLSLPSARACVMLMEAEVAYLERYGQDRVWIPNNFWLASCSRADLYQVSPHLLDRFALRLPGSDVVSSDRLTNLVADLKTSPPVDYQRKAALPPDFRKLLRRAVKYRPSLEEEVVAHIPRYFSKTSHFGVRREIALACLSIAHAQLIGAEYVTIAHVDTVAALIGLKLEKSERNYSRLTLPLAVDGVDTTEEASLSTTSLENNSISSKGTPVHSPDTQEIFSSTSLSGPYLEDSVPKDQEIASLQLKPLGYSPSKVRKGAIIGIERAISLRDLALVSTILEAAKFQVVRRKYILKRTINQLRTAIQNRDLHSLQIWKAFRQDQFLFSSSDLRSYRRMPIPKQLLVLVLDYTCLQDCLWEEAIIPHLEWAYTERASVCLIQVGAATVEGKAMLRARQIIAPSILAPRVRSAFGVGSGQATPLAHGLDLAGRTLRKTLQSERGVAQRARLVILSDGRGNIPLKASQTGVLEWPVNREGIEDALEVGRSIRNLKSMEAFFLNPQPQQYPNLPFALAEAIGVIPDPIRLKDTEDL